MPESGAILGNPSLLDDNGREERRSYREADPHAFFFREGSMDDDELHRAIAMKTLLLIRIRIEKHHQMDHTP